MNAENRIVALTSSLAESNQKNRIPINWSLCSFLGRADENFVAKIATLLVDSPFLFGIFPHRIHLQIATLF